MKKRIIILAIIIAILQCCTQKNLSHKLFCENELLLFSGFNTSEESDFSLFEIRTETETKLETLTESVSCHYFNLLLNFKADSLTKIPLNIHIDYKMDCKYPPVLFTPRHYIFLFLVEQNALYKECNDICIDDLEDIIFAFYHSKPREVFDVTFISLYWDNTICESFFQNVIIKCLKGYSRFIDNKSNTIYGKNICELTREELLELYYQFPLNIRTDFTTDDLYYLRPPTPPLPADNNRNIENRNIEN